VKLFYENLFFRKNTLFSYHLLFSLLEFSFPINKIDLKSNKKKKGEWKFLKKRNSSFFGKK